MTEDVYKVFVDIWRLAYKYRFCKLTDEQWEEFIADGKKLFDEQKGSKTESFFRSLFAAVQELYEQIGKDKR